MKSAPSVVQIHNQQVVLTAPSIAGAGTWDTHVLWTGLHTSSSTNSGGGMVANSSSQYVQAYDHSAAGPVPVPFGSLQIASTASGATIKVGNAASGETRTSLIDTLGSGLSRLIAVGVEIHNTTAAINKQGSLTVAQLQDWSMDNTSLTYVDTNAAPWVTAEKQACTLVGVPATVAAAQSIPTAATWAAAEGVYVVPRLTSLSGSGTVHTFLGQRTPMFQSTDSSTYYAAVVNACTSGTNVPLINTATPSGFSPVSIWLTGLSNATSLMVTLRTVVEYFPAAGDALLPVAKPSPPYDVHAFECYSRISRDCPYAVPVGQNAAGDFFREVARIASRVMPFIAPMAGPLAGAVNGAASALRSWSDRPKITRKAAGMTAVVDRDPNRNRSRKVKVPPKGKKSLRKRN